MTKEDKSSVTKITSLKNNNINNELAIFKHCTFLLIPNQYALNLKKVTLPGFKDETHGSLKGNKISLDSF